jgi:hypothetical protein
MDCASFKSSESHAVWSHLDLVDYKFNSDFSLRASWKINLFYSYILIESTKITREMIGVKK